MLEASVLSGRKYPPSGLQLMDVTQSLDPRMIDYLPLGSLACLQLGARAERDVTVDSIVA
jgi:hypothetical protein